MGEPVLVVSGVCTKDLSRFKHDIENDTVITGNRMYFDGTQCREIPDSDSLDITTCSMLAWINADMRVGGSSLHAIVAKGTYDGVNEWLWSIDRTTGFFNIRTSSTYALGTVDIPKSGDRWVRVGITIDGSYAVFYLNGVGDKVVFQTALETNNQPIRIGNDGSENRGFLNYIDDVRIFNFVLPEGYFAEDYRVSKLRN